GIRAKGIKQHFKSCSIINQEDPAFGKKRQRIKKDLWKGRDGQEYSGTRNSYTCRRRLTESLTNGTFGKKGFTSISLVSCPFINDVVHDVYLIIKDPGRLSRPVKFESICFYQYNWVNCTCIYFLITTRQPPSQPPTYYRHHTPSSEPTIAHLLHPPPPPPPTADDNGRWRWWVAEVVVGGVGGGWRCCAVVCGDGDGGGWWG
nr:hypothetical protein [Tanacetum cinerariifolium]